MAENINQLNNQHLKLEIKCKELRYNEQTKSANQN